MGTITWSHTSTWSTIPEQTRTFRTFYNDPNLIISRRALVCFFVFMCIWFHKRLGQFYILNVKLLSHLQRNGLQSDWSFQEITFFSEVKPLTPWKDWTDATFQNLNLFEFHITMINIPLWPCCRKDEKRFLVGAEQFIPSDSYTTMTRYNMTLNSFFN